MKKTALIFSLIIFGIFIHIVNSSEKDFLGLQSEIGVPNQIKYNKTPGIDLGTETNAERKFTTNPDNDSSKNSQGSKIESDEVTAESKDDDFKPHPQNLPANEKDSHDKQDEHAFNSVIAQHNAQAQSAFLGNQASGTIDYLDQEVLNPAGRQKITHHNPDRIAPILRDSILFDGNANKEDEKMHQANFFPEDFGKDLKLRPVKNMDSATDAPCVKREEDGLFACLPDVYWIGTSKSGTSSIAHYLNQHPMIMNIVSAKRAAVTHSKEGHFWEVSEHLFESPEDMIATRIKAMQLAQNGFNTTRLRPVIIEYTPNYFIVDHIPKLLSQGFKKLYPLKFIVSLRDPVNRTLSSWRFKAFENYIAQEKVRQKDAKLQMQPIDVASLEDSIYWGKKRGDCISKCYKRQKKSMVGCNMNKCRKKYDPMCKETKLFAELQEKSAFCCRTAYYAHVTKSLYGYQFAKWFSYFEKAQFFIFTIEEFSKNRIGVLERLLDFLGLPLYDPGGKYGYKSKAELTKILSFVINKTPRKEIFEKQITPEIVESLYRYFSPHNKVLKNVLEFDPGYTIL